LEPIYSSKKLFRARKKPHGLALYFSEINWTTIMQWSPENNGIAMQEFLGMDSNPQPETMPPKH
jgi:hypothetical protein